MNWDFLVGGLVGIYLVRPLAKYIVGRLIKSD